MKRLRAVVEDLLDLYDSGKHGPATVDGHLVEERSVAHEDSASVDPERVGPARDHEKEADVSVLEQVRVAVAAKATDELNASVFARPGLSPDAVEQLVAVLTRMRADAGDF